MLTFIGLGLFDKFDISIKGFNAIKIADIVYLEFYTSILIGSTVKELENFYNKNIILLTREDVEINGNNILEQANTKNVVFLTAGDTMIATTHIDLRIKAYDLKIKTKIIHGASILSAVCGISGLQNYKFGKSTSISYPYISNRGVRVISEYPYNTILQNYFNGLHTLVFLDINNNKFMTVKEALFILIELSNIKNNPLIKNLITIGISKAGSDDVSIKTDYIKNTSTFNLGGPLQVLVIPGKLHFMEEEAIRKFSNNSLKF